ncbi:MAG: hypothetical protein ACI9VS_003569 [Candidatus Binatia bacterium]|jgi:hypothetical protein
MFRHSRFSGAVGSKSIRKTGERTYVARDMISASILRLVGLALFISLALPGVRPGASGAQMVPLSLAQLTEQSQAIVRGTVSSKTCLEDERGRLVTRIRLSVVEVWKGQEVVGEFTIVQAGGTLGDRRVRVIGQPDFTIGEEVVAFLELNARGEGVVLGVCQGKFEVYQDVTGRKQVRNIFHGGATAGSSSTQALQNKLGNRRLTLADLKRSVAARNQ